MAAAYLFHVVKNHPFVDGNKRTGVVAALVFLDLNGVEIDAPRGGVYELTMSVAEGRAGRAEEAAFFRKHAH
jgi:death-on-curing protein